jgi:hypothetical protein
MSRQYPIWKKISNDSYATDKSHGVRDKEVTNIFVGTSAKNSHFFLSTEIECHNYKDGSKHFLFFIDGVLIKIAVLNADGTLEIKTERTKELLSKDNQKYFDLMNKERV